MSQSATSPTSAAAAAALAASTVALGGKSNLVDDNRKGERGSSAPLRSGEGVGAKGKAGNQPTGSISAAAKLARDRTSQPAGSGLSSSSSKLAKPLAAGGAAAHRATANSLSAGEDERAIKMARKSSLSSARGDDSDGDSDDDDDDDDDCENAAKRIRGRKEGGSAGIGGNRRCGQLLQGRLTR